MKSYKILWLSRHLLQASQAAELEAVFGPSEIVRQAVTLDNDARKGAAQIEALMELHEADDLVGVMPVAHLAALTRIGIRPIRAVMSRTPTGQTLENGEVEYRFDHERFERIVEVTVETESLASPQTRTLEWKARWSGGMKECAVLIRDGEVTPQADFATHVEHVPGGSELYTAEVAEGDVVLLLYQSGSGKTETVDEVGGEGMWLTWSAAERDLGLERGALREAFQ